MKARHALVAAALAAAWGFAGPAAAHCDTLDGPVVGAARQALETGKVEHALIWVQKGDERTIRDAYAKARAARAKGGKAAEQADTAFFATLVRVHRKGEGAPFTGLKPAGQIEPPIVAADRALETGKLADVATPIVERVHTGLEQRFEAVMSRRGFDPSNVEAGRAWVGAYVQYVHFAEGLYNAAAPMGDAPAAAHGAAHGHGAAPAHAH